MRKTISYILILLIFSCSTRKQTGAELLNKSKDVEIVKDLIFYNNNWLYINELRIHLPSALHADYYMFEKYGHWNKVIKGTGYDHYLVWQKCRLFEEKDDLYTVATSGVETRKELYSSVIVLNKDNIDLLKKGSKLRYTLVKMFYYGTKNSTLSDDKFFHEFWNRLKENQ